MSLWNLFFLYYLYTNQPNILLGSTWHRVNDYNLCLYLHHQMMQFSHKWFKSLFHYIACIWYAISMNLYCTFQSMLGYLLLMIKFIHLISILISRSGFNEAGDGCVKSICFKKQEWIRVPRTRMSAICLCLQTVFCIIR